MTRDEFTSVWKAARGGDADAKHRLYQIVKTSVAIQKLSRAMGKGADSEREKYLKSIGRKTVVKADSTWTKARNNLGPKGANVVSGGLPSLGKNK